MYWVEVLGEADGGVRIRNVVEKCKKPVESVEAIIEPDLLYPLLRWSDLARYAPLPRYHLLLVQDCERRVGLDESFLKRRFPLTYAYLRQFETLLTSRAAYRRYQGGQPFYSMYNVGPYTMADYKVVWRRMDKRLNAAVVEPVDHPLLGRRPVVPQETCVLIACHSAEESHYLCAMLNSEPAGRLIRIAQRARRKRIRHAEHFGLSADPPVRSRKLIASRIVRCSREAHRIQREAGCQPVQTHGQVANLPHVQKQIDRLAEEAFRGSLKVRGRKTDFSAPPPISEKPRKSQA